MKILYITVPSFFDLEVSLIREISKFVEINVMLVVSPQSQKSSAFSINALPKQCDIFRAVEYEGVQKYKDIIDLENWYIANNPDNSFLSCFKLSNKIRKFIKENRFDFLHTTTNCKTIFFLTPLFFSFPKTMLTVHDPIPHKKLSWFDNFFRRKLFFVANKNLLFLSKVLLNDFCKEYRFKKDRIFFSRLGIYDVLNSYEIVDNPYGKYILFFGRIESYKGVDLLIDAFEKTNLPSKGINLVIAGKGKIRRDFNELPKNVILINRFIENEELANLIYHCRYVVLPYLSATQSGCVMSAYAFNKPVLATDVGDLPLTICHGKTGMICKANDVYAICSMMNEMECANLSMMQHNIKARYQENGPFSWCSIAKALCGVYNEIISK